MLWLKAIRLCGISLLILLLSGCVANAPSDFKISDLAKSDIDNVTDMHISQVRKLTRELAIKLYKRNPSELAKAPPGTTVTKRLQQLLDTPRTRRFKELNGAEEIKAIQLSFNEEFQGDRVFALMVGISGMLNAAYNYQDEFFLLDAIDQQKLYNSARNLEITAWQLNNRKNSQNEPYILSNSISVTGIRNLSYERIFGKLISLQDMMALLVADRTNRTITRVVQSAASMTFLPI